MTWGLALSGGGARGAYTAGVQRYLFTELPKKLGFTPYPDYVSGVSVGAINGYFSATHSDEEIRRMTEIWHNLKIEDMYNLPTGPISFISTRPSSVQDCKSRTSEISAANNLEAFLPK